MFTLIVVIGAGVVETGLVIIGLPYFLFTVDWKVTSTIHYLGQSAFFQGLESYSG